jgi:hypothetical protein
MAERSERRPRYSYFNNFLWPSLYCVIDYRDQAKIAFLSSRPCYAGRPWRPCLVARSGYETSSKSICRSGLGAHRGPVLARVQSGPSIILIAYYYFSQSLFVDHHLVALWTPDRTSLSNLPYLRPRPSLLDPSSSTLTNFDWQFKADIYSFDLQFISAVYVFLHSPQWITLIRGLRQLACYERQCHNQKLMRALVFTP